RPRPTRGGESGETPRPPTSFRRSVSRSINVCKKKETRQEGNRGRTMTMLKPILLGGALALLPAAQLNAEPILLKLNSPAPPWSFVNKEVLGPWAEAARGAWGATLPGPAFYGGNGAELGTTPR